MQRGDFNGRQLTYVRELGQLQRIITVGFAFDILPTPGLVIRIGNL